MKKEYKSDKKSREPKEEKTKVTQKEHDNEMVENYLSEQRKYSSLKKDIPKKGAERLAPFLKKYFSVFNGVFVYILRYYI